MADWVLFPFECQGFFGYPWHTPDVSAYEVHRHQCFLFGDNADRFGIRNVYSMDAFMKRHGFGSWRFPWELGESYFAWHSFFELCVWWAPPDFVLYIKHPERTIFHIHWPWNSAEVPSFFILLEQKRCRLNHGRCSWGKENRG